MKWWEAFPMFQSIRTDYANKYYPTRCWKYLTDEEIENIFYNEVVLTWWNNLKIGVPIMLISTYLKKANYKFPTNEEIKEIYLKEHSNTITPAKVFDDLNDLMSNKGIFSSNPLSVNKDVEVKHLKQPQIIKDFISAIKSEFKNENWDYLDFIADRVIER